MSDTENLSSGLDFFTQSPAKEEKPTAKDEAADSIEEAAGDEATEEGLAEEKAEGGEQNPPKEGASEEREPWTKAAYLDEKGKRQALEERIKQLEQAATERTEQGKQPSEAKQENEAATEEDDAEAPDHLDDPKGYAKWVRDKAEAGALKKAQAEIFRNRVLDLVDAMREKHPDFDEMAKVFGEMERSNPDLTKKFFSERNPVKFAYQAAKDYTETKRLSDPAEKAKWEEQIRKEEREKVLAEQSSKEASKPKLPNMPDLLNAASARSGMETKPRLKSGTDFFAR